MDFDLTHNMWQVLSTVLLGVFVGVCVGVGVFVALLLVFRMYGWL